MKGMETAEICKNCEEYRIGDCRGFVDSGRDDCAQLRKIISEKYDRLKED